MLSYLLLAGSALCFRPGLNIQRVRVMRSARCPPRSIVSSALLRLLYTFSFSSSAQPQPRRHPTRSPYEVAQHGVLVHMENSVHPPAHTHRSGGGVT